MGEGRRKGTNEKERKSVKTSGDVNADPLLVGTGGTQQTACKQKESKVCQLLPVCAQ